jgi:hypothetical protein
MLRFVLKFCQQYFNFKIFQEVVIVFFCFKTLVTNIFKAILKFFIHWIDFKILGHVHQYIENNIV